MIEDNHIIIPDYVKNTLMVFDTCIANFQERIDKHDCPYSKLIIKELELRKGFLESKKSYYQSHDVHKEKYDRFFTTLRQVELFIMWASSNSKDHEEKYYKMGSFIIPGEF